MVRYNNFGVNLVDNSKELSEENKVISIHLFGKCDRCKEEIELKESMFTDNCNCENNNSFSGWKYKCNCGKNVQVWENVFDTYLDYLYENNLINVE